jgi:hypothetical protein
MMAFSANGCGKLNETKGDVNENSYVMKADNPQVREFNKQLGEISNEATAERAVNSFVSYVDSRLMKSGTSVQSLNSLLKPEVVKEMARKEAAARGAGGMSIASEDEPPAQLLDIGTITDNINSLGRSDGVRVDDDTVTTVKAVAEESIPNMNPEKKNGMTPLEACVIGYALVSGDDGTATNESVNLPVDKVSNFVENITQ